MLRQVQATIEKRGLLRPGQHVLVAVSGGADSVAMLLALHRLSPALNLRLSVAHLNHCIRGPAANRDEAFVKRLARRLRLPCETERVNVPRVARGKGISLEMAGREMRYAFIHRTAQRIGADAAATAHTADDQAETVLLKLARGAGLKGIGGIDYTTKVHGIMVVRPLLDISRKEIVEFLRKERAEWREDESNLNLDILRNRVRHEILPLIELRLNPRLKEALVRTSDLAREDDGWLDEIAHSILRRCLTSPPKALKGYGRRQKHGVAMNCERLCKYPLSARRRVLRLWLASCGVPIHVIGFDVVADIEDLIRLKHSGSTVNLPDRWFVKKRHNCLLAERKLCSLSEKPFRCRVKVPGETILPSEGLRVVAEVSSGVIKKRSLGPGMLPAQAWLSRAAVGKRALFVRSWLPGDRMKPLGLDGSKKVQDIFTDSKVPREARHRIPLFECAGEIVWLPGYRVARGWEVSGADNESVRILVERVEALQ